jgi:extradiol dioxygenase family protein
MALRPFHVAIPVHDLDAAREFYGGLLGCPEGRSDTHWVDFSLYGHQFVCHYSETLASQSLADVDHQSVPVPHYGVVLDWADWQLLADRLIAAGIKFICEPAIRFVGEPGEQATLFVADPSGNALEFKAMRDNSQLFSK